MSPQDRNTPGSPAAWLARAHGDLAIAKVPLPAGAFYEDLRSHAQQAAEKAIKAVYAHRGLPFRYVHDLGTLTAGLAAAGISISDGVSEATALTSYASAIRYPGLEEPVTRQEYETAVLWAETVMRWAERQVEGGPA
jgi:HEPN domain-containing protein